jgi:hypothetical protein
VSGLAAKLFRLLASLKVAIPLLVLLIGVTIAGSLFPTPEIFRTKWYLGLLGILGLSLLLITMKHAPLGILVVIAGVIYGGFTGFRHEIKLIEGEVTIVPGLPFAIRLDELVVEEYDQADFPNVNLNALPKQQQDSRVTLLKSGKEWKAMSAAPGNPARINGITLLPDISDIGWVYDLIVTDAIGREKTVPVRPWALPVITLGGRQVMAHGRGGPGDQEVEILERDGEQIASLGMVTRDEPLLVDGATRPIDVTSVALGAVRKYTAAKVYNRPQEGILLWGSVLMFAGLVWHFYFRHRDRRREGKSDA